MKYLEIIAAVLLLIGGLNWGLIGLFGVNVVEAVFSHFPELVRVIYGLVGLSALYEIGRFFGHCGGGTCCKK